MITNLYYSSFIPIVSSGGSSACDGFVRLKKFFYKFFYHFLNLNFIGKEGDIVNGGKEFRIWWHYIGSNDSSVSFIGSKVFETVDQVREEFLNMFDDADKVVISKIEIVG